MATPDAPSTNIPLTLWLTDRSRYSTGTGRCGRQRYLTNHFGPTGYGIVRKADSLPLATGSYAHKVCETLWKYLQQHDQLPPPEIIRAAIEEANGAYLTRIEARGYRGLLQSERSDYVVAEQQALIAGLVWAFSKVILPWFHAEYRVLQCELESIYILDCTCGLGSQELDPYAHEARDCHGVGQQLKQDVIAERRQGGGLAYLEVKTTGWAGDTWASQWETRPQLAIGTFGIPERYSKEVTELYVVGLYKGSRKTKGEGEDQRVEQDSPFCYGYRKAGNPPLATDDWKPAYEWLDPVTGETKYARRPYAKSPVWLLPESDWPDWQYAQAAGWDPVEWWATQFLPESVLKKSVFLVGPLNRQDAQIESLKRQIVGEERKWQDLLWKLYEAQHDRGLQWADPEFQALLDHLVPASWDCQRYGSKHGCEFIPLCFKQSGWEDPVGTDHFVPRRPHHEPELQQAISRGLLPEQAEEGDEEE